ncbi:unnamed protein product [Pedinophyceae sp. YPF-701]|nr:unnamed protein product [Pedinophyceae sp. YPF-701]
MNRYIRPAAKSGGHGVGWQEVPRYSFVVPQGWDEVPVSIADLGGTEIDLRFASTTDEGSAAVVIAPIGRFRDDAIDSDFRITDLGEPQQIIEGFAPELTRSALNENDLIEMSQFEGDDGLPYYTYQIRTDGFPHVLVTAAAKKNRVFLFTIYANNRQWRKNKDTFRTMANSFTVDSEQSPKLARFVKENFAAM